MSDQGEVDSEPAMDAKKGGWVVVRQVAGRQAGGKQAGRWKADVA